MNFSRFIKFLLVGGATFVADYGVFLTLVYIAGWSVFIANALGLLVGFMISFFGNRTLVFSSKDAHHSLAQQILLYGALLVVNTLLSYLIIQGASSLGLSLQLAKLIAMAFIVGWNFVIYGRVIFKQSRAESSQDFS